MEQNNPSAIAANEELTEKVIPIWNLIIKNIVLILVLLVLGGLAGTAYGAVKSKPIYTAKVSVMFAPELNSSMSSSSAATTNVTLAKMYLPTLHKIIVSSDTLEIVNQLYADDGYVGKISKGAISVNRSDTSCIFSISYSAGDADIAEKALSYVIKGTEKAIDDSYESDSPLIMAEKVSLVPTQSDFDVSVSNGFIKYVLIGFAIGLAAAILIVVLRYLLDNKVKSEEELEDIAGADVLAVLEC